MKHKKHSSKYVRTSTAIALIFLAILLSTCASYFVFGNSSTTFTISSGVYPGAPSFTVYKEGSKYYAKNAYGVIEYSGTNASQIFQSVIDALPDTGGKILIRRGHYFMDAPLNITKNSVYLEGEGYSWGFIDQINALLPNNATALIATPNFPSDKFMINFHPPKGKNVMIGGGLQGIALDGGKVNQLFEDPSNNTWYSGGGVFINNTHGVRITDCTFTRHGGHAIYAYSNLQSGYLTGGGISDIQIERNCIRNIGYGNYIGFGNVFWPQKASGIGIFLDVGCWVASVINNWVTRTYDYNIAVASWGGRIIGNECEWATVNPERGDYSEDPTDPSKAVYMSGSAIYVKEYGILVEGNHIIWPDRHGIVTYGRNLVVGNNILQVNRKNFTGSAGGAGIHAEGHNLNLTIVGNVIADVGEDYGDERLMEYGIVVAGASNSSSTIVANMISGARNQSIWQTNSTVAYNVGWVTENSGTVEASNDDWIAHGLCAAPTCVILTIEETDSRYFLQVKARNSTHFQIYLYDAIADAFETVDKTIHWHAEYKP